MYVLFRPSPPNANSTVLVFARLIIPFFLASFTILAFLTIKFFLFLNINLEPAKAGYPSISIRSFQTIGTPSKKLSLSFFFCLFHELSASIKASFFITLVNERF